MKTGILILAAGNSSRLGEPKQLLTFNGRSLLFHVTEQALQLTKAVIVVTGSRNAEIKKEVENLESLVTENINWQEGMSSSVNKGLNLLLATFPTVENCIISVCDQPYLTTSVFSELVQKQRESQKGIVASAYSDTLGTPVLFTKKYFSEVLSLSGKEGAKKLLQKFEADTTAIYFGKGAVDIDTQDDYKQLIKPQMISVKEAKKIITETALPKKSVVLPLSEAFGLVTSHHVMAATDIPGFAQSSMDGYALQHSDKNSPLNIIGEMAAGTSIPLKIKNGEATRIFTGAPLPENADTVVMQEKISFKNNQLIIEDENLTEGLNVRLKGAEVKKGEIAMTSETYLSAAAIGFLAGIGCAEVAVYAPPKVAVVLTGNELQQPGTPLEFGQVYEANSFQLKAVLKQTDIKDIEVFRSGDDPDELKTVLETALLNNDVVLLNGGVSVGDYDFVTQVARSCGVEEKFHKIKQKPGKPLFFGSKNDKLIFGLPGNPSSSLTCFYQYVLPALRKSMGLNAGIVEIMAVSTHHYPKAAGLTHFLKAFYNHGKVTPLHAQESFRLHSFAQANCFMVLPEESLGCQAGEQVTVHLFTV